MKDVISFYTPIRATRDSGRVPCPFHNGHDRNFSYNKDVFQCWVCGETGNTISFVAKLFGLSNMDALRKIDEDFCLGIVNSKVKLSRKRRIERQMKEAQRESADVIQYRKLCSELHDLNDYIEEHRKEFTDELAEAIMKRSKVEEQIAELWEVISNE